MISDESGGDGAEVIYALRNNSTLSKKITDEIAKEGQNIRKYYQQRLPSNPVKDYYFIHRNTPDTEAVIVEYGFLDSPGDDVNELKNNYKDYAEAVVRALANYTGKTYIAPETSDYYTVVKGDSLWSIANKYGITVNELKSLNNLTTNTIHVGDTLKIKSSEEKLPENYLVYTVQKGDSLYSIANKYGTTVTTLMDINNLSGSGLQINQQLFIPKEKNIDIEVEKEKGVEYIVKSGDTLYKIATSYGVSVDELKKANNLTSNTLSVGQKLTIPVSETVVEETTKTEPMGVNYVVQKGDNLYSIANKYSVTVDDLKKENNLTTNTLSIGQILLIPGTSNYANYTVVKGDSLWSIARKYGTTVGELKIINNLETTALSIGQELLIPTK